jgi:hypothetical protein
MENRLEELLNMFGDLLDKKYDRRVIFYKTDKKLYFKGEMVGYNWKMRYRCLSNNSENAKRRYIDLVTSYIPSIKVRYYDWVDCSFEITNIEKCIKEVEEAIRKLKKRRTKRMFEIGHTYKLLQDIELSTRIIAEKGSVVKVTGTIPKPWGGYFLAITPISGRYALTVHSDFFPNPKKHVCGSRNKFYTLDELKDILGIDDFKDWIPFDDFNSEKFYMNEIKEKAEE